MSVKSEIERIKSLRNDISSRLNALKLIDKSEATLDECASAIGSMPALIELTQAEYNSLAESGRINDNDYYFIIEE